MSLFCQFEPVADRKQCRRCGYAIATAREPGKIHRVCPGSVAERTERLMSAIGQRILSGCATRPLTAIEAMLAKCRKCGWWLVDDCVLSAGCRQEPSYVERLTLVQYGCMKRGKISTADAGATGRFIS